jgi:transposase
MRAYSPDLRARVLRALDEGMSKREAARIFDVGLSTVKRYAKQRHETGSLASKPIPGRPARIEKVQQEALRSQIIASPEATLSRHCQLWEQAHGTRVSTATMSRAIRRLGWRYKNGRWVSPGAPRRFAPASDR